ncbi:hypothetical protein [Actinoplanes xinjiangensis]|uniref:hypothetical protein n=1 Tax=Actinoplanes xinjiangensis TaxID=512350 RepID=UPI00342334DB
MRILLRAALTCAFTMIVGLAAPALAAPALAAPAVPASLPTAEQLRAALLTAAELPGGLSLKDSDSGRIRDSDFAVGDRCADDWPQQETEVAFAVAGFVGDTRQKDVFVGMFLGATGAANGPTIVSQIAAETDGCPGTEATGRQFVRWPLPALGDASLGVITRDLPSRRLRAAVIAQGDVLGYLVTSGLGEREAIALARTWAAKLALHFT